MRFLPWKGRSGLPSLGRLRGETLVKAPIRHTMSQSARSEAVAAWRAVAPMPPGSQTAFFSYCREDSGFALKLAEDLKAAGAHVWIDQLDIEPGTPWDRAVEDALNKAPRMLVVLSPISVNSDNVRDEVSFALSQKKRVIPVLYRDCDIPFRLARLQYIDFRPEYERGLKILLRALGVGQAGEHASGAPAVGPVAEHILSKEEQASAESHVAELERERAAAPEWDRLINEARVEAQQQAAAAAEQRRAEEEGRRAAAAEQARAEEERRAKERARIALEERERADSEVQARQEQLRREQRLAEQARLETEAREAAEKARVAQEEQTRREAEIKARQEQLRREEQESVERKSFDWNQLAEETKKSSQKAEQVELENAHEQDSVNDDWMAEPEKPGIASAQLAFAGELPAAGKARSSKLYLGLGALIVLLLAVTLWIMNRGSKPSGPAKSQVAESKLSESPSAATSQSSQASAPVTSPGPTSPASQGPASQPAADAGGMAASGPASGGSAAQQEIKAPLQPPSHAAQMAVKSAAASPTATKGTGGLTRVQLPADVSKNFLIHEVAPPYPPLARQARIHGVVTLKVLVDRTGAVQNIRTVSGHPLLVPTAIDAVKQWRYRPFVVDDKPVEVDTVVTVRFELTN